MRIPNDEFGLWEKGNILRAFVIGGVASCCLVYMALTDSIPVFFAALGMVIICTVLFIDLCMVMRARFFLSHNIISAVFGFLVSLFIYVNATWMFPLYFMVLVIALILLWFRRHVFKKRKIRNPFSSASSRKKPI